ncbi:MAG: HAD family phosphatase, partial [Deltaproteobacteria bacterium]|nr:HAD family phosphatase [Deltaproteobacteria bacterium]
DLKSQSLLLPGAKEFIEHMSSQYYLAIVSGALRSEIEMILETAGLKKKFHVIVAAEDVSQGKPRPDGFILAIRLLNRDHVPPSEILLSEECLVIEDSPWGLEAAKLAGVKSLALLTSYPRERLTLANLIAPDLRHLKWDQVEALFPIS